MVFSKDFDEQVNCLDRVLTQIQSAGLRSKASKCVFFATDVFFLGHNLMKEGILPNPENVAKILNWPVLKKMWDVRGILGLGNYLSLFYQKLQ